MFDFGFHNWYQSHQLACKGVNHYGNRLENLENLYFLPMINSKLDQLHLLCEKCSRKESNERINVYSTYSFAIQWFKQFELHYLGYVINKSFITKKQENKIQEREFQDKLLFLSNCINKLNNKQIESFLLSIWTTKMIQNNEIDKQFEEQQFLIFVKKQSNQLFSLASRYFYNIFLKADVKLKSQDDCDIVQIQVSRDFVFLLENSLLYNKQITISIYLYPSLEYVDSFKRQNINIEDFIMKSSVHSNLLLFQNENNLNIMEISVETERKGENAIQFLINYHYKHNCHIIDLIIEDNNIVFIDQTYKLFRVYPLKKKSEFLTKKLQSLQKTNQKLITQFHYYNNILIIELCNRVLTMSLQNCKFQKISSNKQQKQLSTSSFCKPNKIIYSVLQQQDNEFDAIKNEIVQYSFQCNKRLRRVKLGNQKQANMKLSLKKDLKTLILLSNEYITVFDMQKGVQVFFLPFAQNFYANNYDFQGYFLIQNQEKRALIWKQEKLFERDIRLFFKRL